MMLTRPNPSPHRPAAFARWLGAQLLPCQCAVCRRSQAHLVCSSCAQTLFQKHDASVRCPCCAIPLPASLASERCGACVQDPPSFGATYTLGDYAAPADALVQALKFKAELPLAHWLGQALAHHAAHTATLPDLFLPIPLHPQRMVERGFNQSWEICQPLAQALQRPARADLLTRVRWHPPQATLTLSERRKNVRNAFAVAQPTALQGLHIGLVDDVMTTGSTLEEAARTLLRHGAAHVSCWVALRTPK